jgi:hypothetical protein
MKETREEASAESDREDTDEQAWRRGDALTFLPKQSVKRRMGPAHGAGGGAPSSDQGQSVQCTRLMHRIERQSASLEWNA